MYGVIIEKGPVNWQVLQQSNGYASAHLEGRIFVEEDVLSQNAAVVVRAVDEKNGSRITPPVFAKIADGKWSADLKMPTGGPYKIETFLRFNDCAEKRGDRRFHIGVGDNYVITGQSNAVGVGKDSADDPSDENVRMYRLGGSWDIAAHPLHDTTDTKYPEFAERVAAGHSPWIAFAKVLSRKLGYPIGLIPATKGGIPLSFWDRREDGRFFSHMLNVLNDCGSGVKGIIWYHGCNDTYDDTLRKTYYERFKYVCKDFRKELGGLPIITVQLNKCTCTKGRDLDSERKHFNELREAQRKAAHSIEDLYIVPSIDLPVCDGIHNSCMANIVIGQRAANTALAHIYGKEVVCDAPDIIKAVKTAPKKVELRFKNVYTCLFSDYNPTELLPFSLTDENGRQLPSDYSIKGACVILEFEREIGKNATVSCDGPCESGLVPYDMFSYLPILMFDDLKVEY